jgi:hypothetical protein
MLVGASQGRLNEETFKMPFQKQIWEILSDALNFALT